MPEPGFPGCPRPGWPPMSEGWDRVATPWWLQQVGVGGKASTVVGAPVRAQGEEVTDGRQPAQERDVHVGEAGRF